jgi:hypothetical protein
VSGSFGGGGCCDRSLPSRPRSHVIQLIGVTKARPGDYVSSRPEELHPRALPKPCMTLSSHTAPDVQPLP